MRLDEVEGDRSVDHVDLRGRASYRHHGAAAWFAGTDDRAMRFGWATRQLDEGGEGLVGVRRHEVAHASRHAHGLDLPDRDTEELLTDLSTIFLGFGVFTVNNTLRYRTEVFEDGPMAASRYPPAAPAGSRRSR